MGLGCYIGVCILIIVFRFYFIKNEDICKEGNNNCGVDFKKDKKVLSKMYWMFVNLFVLYRYFI